MLGRKGGFRVQGSVFWILGSEFRVRGLRKARVREFLEFLKMGGSYRNPCLCGNDKVIIGGWVPN